MTHGSRTAPLRLGLVQFAPRKGQGSENLARIARLVQEYAGRCHVLVFPEAAVTGYELQGAVEAHARTAEELAAALGSPPEGAPDVVLGFYERAGGNLHNAAAHLEPRDGAFEVVHVHRKLFLPTYGIFQEGRFLTPGSELTAYDTRFGRVGLLVCEDALHSIAPTLLALDGAHLLLTVAAAPARGFAPGRGQPESLLTWERAVGGAAAEHGAFAAVTQQVGSEGGKLHPGGALAADPKGRIMARGPLLEEDVVTVELDPGEVGRARAQAPMLADLRATLPTLMSALGPSRFDDGTGRPSLRGPRSDRKAASSEPEENTPVNPGPSPEDRSVLEIDPLLVERFLVRFLRDEFRQRGFRRAVIGVSGGLDSAVSLLLTARALGPENVHALALPDTGSRPESEVHAAAVCRAAGVTLRTLPVAPMVEAYVEGAEPEPSPGRRGNVAARMRALVLFDQAAAHEALPVGSGNKSERLLGYFTWHGDDAPPINPLGDLFKTQVTELARFLEVPEEVVTKAPSADLVPGVDDADELGLTYEEADPILHWLLQGYRAEELVDRDFQEERVHRVVQLLEGTHWKRGLPTTAVLSDTAIGQFYLRPVDL